MSKANILRHNSTLWMTTRINIQQYLCDKGGGVTIIRNVNAAALKDPCNTDAYGCDVKMDLKCKVALVTGGAQGIGYAIANELLKEGLHRVVIGDIDPCKGIRAAHRLNELHGEDKCCYIPLNVACTKQLEDVMYRVKENYENLDILVNNAAILSPNIDLEIDTNYRPVIHSTKIALSLMKTQKNKGGLVLNIGDVKGITGCKFFPLYASEKSGVHIFSMGLGKETEKKFKVRVVTLAPGLTETEMGSHFVNKPDKAINQQRPTVVGRAAIYTAKYADSASIYLVENRKLYKVEWPCKNAFLDFIETI